MENEQTYLIHICLHLGTQGTTNDRMERFSSFLRPSVLKQLQQYVSLVPSTFSTFWQQIFPTALGPSFKICTLHSIILWLSEEVNSKRNSLVFTSTSGLAFCRCDKSPPFSTVLDKLYTYRGYVQLGYNCNQHYPNLSCIYIVITTSNDN